MAGIKWSGANSKGFQVGVEVLVAYPNATQVTVTCRAWIRGGTYASTYDADISVSMYGSHSGVWTTSSAGRDGAKLVGSKAITYNRKYGAPVKGAIGVRAERLYGGDVAVTNSWFIPALPYSVPAAPSEVSAVRVSGSQVDVTYAVAGTASAPVSGVYVERQDDGDGVWRNVATIVGTGKKTWSDTGVSDGGMYQYRVLAYGAGGSSVPTVTPVLYMRPLAPVGVVARRDGANIVVEWGNSAIGDEYRTQIWDGDRLLATVGAGVTSWVHKTPSSSVPHTYKLCAVVGLHGVGTDLQSTFALSDTVNLLAPPLAPTGLEPSGYAPKGEPVVLSWIHNPTDTTGQTRAELEYTVEGVTKTVTIGEKSEYVLPAQTADRVSWRVRTAGEHANYGAWSNPAVAYFVDRPTLQVGKISNPLRGDTATLSWATDLEGEYQFEVEWGESAYTGIASEPEHDYKIGGLENKTTYSVRVRVLGKVWSVWSEQSFTVSYPAPAPGVLNPTVWDPDKACLSITAQFGNLPDVAPTVGMTLEVWRDGKWVKLADITKPTVVFDYLAYPGQVNKYRTITRSDNGLTSTTIHEVPVGNVSGVVLMTEDNSDVVVLKYDVEKSVDVAPSDLAFHYMAGRKKPVAFFGVHDSRTVKISAVILASEVDQIVPSLERLCFARRRVLYRDPEGTRVWGVINGGVSLSRERKIGSYKVSVSLTEVDYGKTR